MTVAISAENESVTRLLQTRPPTSIRGMIGAMSGKNIFRRVTSLARLPVWLLSFLFCCASSVVTVCLSIQNAFIFSVGLGLASTLMVGTFASAARNNGVAIWAAIAGGILFPPVALYLLICGWIAFMD